MDAPAAFKKREKRIYLEGNSRGQNRRDPGQLPGNRNSWLPVRIRVSDSFSMRFEIDLTDRCW
jgi:hypothetical protein